MTVLLNLQIELSPGNAANLPIVENATPKELAAKFVQKYNLNESKIYPIASYIYRQIYQLQSDGACDLVTRQTQAPQKVYPPKTPSNFASIEQRRAADRLSRFVSPRQDPFSDEFEELVPQKAVKFADPETFERLYNDAAERKRKAASAEPRPRATCITREPDYIYKKYTYMQRERDYHLEQLRHDKAALEARERESIMEQCSFKPGITEKGKCFKRDEELYESLYRNTYIKTRIQETKKMIERIATAEETFSPKINRESKYYRRCSSYVQRERATKEMGPYLAIELLPDEVKKLRVMQEQSQMRYYQ